MSKTSPQHSVLLLCILLFSATCNATDIPTLLTGSLGLTPLTNVANFFVGADKLGGKYTTAGLLLGAPILTGRYSGNKRLSLPKGGLLKASIGERLDDLFAPLLSAEPFKYDPFGVKGAVGSLFEAKTGTALTAGGDIVSSKLRHKLDTLSSALGLKYNAANLIDSTIRTKERIVRGAIDGGERIIERDPQTAALKNLLFRGLIYHLYIDAGVNARLSMLKHLKQRVFGYKKLFGPLSLGVDEVAAPVIGQLEGVYSTLSDLITLPTQPFYVQEAEGGDDTVSYNSFYGLISDLQERIGDTNEYFMNGQEGISNTLQSWLGRLQSSRGVGAIDSAQSWRNGVSNYLDTETVTLETQLNNTLQQQNAFLIDFVNGQYNPDVNTDASRIVTYLNDLGSMTSRSASSAVQNYVDFSQGVLSTIEGLVRDGATDPSSYSDAFNLLANGGATAATSVWQLYQRAFAQQRDVAEMVGATLPDVSNLFASQFSQMLNVLANVPGYFRDRL